MANIAQLNEQFGLPGLSRVVAGNGGLAKVEITGVDAVGEVYLHGAHVTSWVPDGQSEMLFMSGKSNFKDGSPIRGGVPICFPWFGPKKDNASAPAHGFVRLSEWELKGIGMSRVGPTVTLQLDVADHPLWPGKCRATYVVTIAQQLSLELTIENTGPGPFTYETALHTYFRVRDVEMVRVRGLDGVEFIDKMEGGARRTQEGEIAFRSETDRVYLNVSRPVLLDDPSIGRKIVVEGTNARNAVVWNPWVAKSKAMADFGDEEWKRMVCIESGNVLDAAITLAAGERHTTSQLVRELVPELLG